MLVPMKIIIIIIIFFKLCWQHGFPSHTHTHTHTESLSLSHQSFLMIIALSSGIFVLPASFVVSVKMNWRCHSLVFSTFFLYSICCYSLKFNSSHILPDSFGSFFLHLQATKNPDLIPRSTATPLRLLFNLHL